VLDLRLESGRLRERILGDEVSLLRLRAAELEVVGKVFYHLCQSKFRGALERRGITPGRGCLVGVRATRRAGTGRTVIGWGTGAGPDDPDGTAGERGVPECCTRDGIG
jgi:hypothetical protein